MRNERRLVVVQIKFLGQDIRILDREPLRSSDAREELWL